MLRFSLTVVAGALERVRTPTTGSEQCASTGSECSGTDERALSLGGGHAHLTQLPLHRTISAGSACGPRKVCLHPGWPPFPCSSIRCSMLAVHQLALARPAGRNTRRRRCPEPPPSSDRQGPIPGCRQLPARWSPCFPQPRRWRAKQLLHRVDLSLDTARAGRIVVERGPGSNRGRGSAVAAAHSMGGRGPTEQRVATSGCGQQCTQVRVGDGSMAHGAR